ncbi:GNAT family N-acetyltransferase [Actinoalloteichus hymeniacidonis]|uniref:Acetyltransferase (GNAT) family protein n=1 Tax=Actinoalloteichus hymeniacidonis TaxID=340345 RepID=A0AAC9HRN3_9PSEU|nr:GNAT family N-acetyltransferase [Actinoalloteichus hymeniacidonis]AOS64103.1 acetyltransferase (GNAT) family protein [Actinoalloteichus hymeniacidonis]MBB5907833.1 GNAT superfamily N-acetyltransferase [Actinoalloteichus hymeniacidonis]
MTDINPDSVESMRQLVAGWRPLVLDAAPTADIRDLPGLSIRWADSRFLFWNALTFTEVGADSSMLAERLDQAARIMRAKSRPGNLWLFEDLLDEAARWALPEAAERAGLTLSFTGAGMAIDFRPDLEPSHPLLTFVRVTTDEQIEAYADLNSRAYGFDLADGRDGLVGSELWKTEIHAYLGLLDGVPVTAAATMACDGRLFVVLVATAPEHSRQGFGAAVTRKALHEGARATGLTRATLHATPDGASVYRRIGFQANSPIHFYSLAG